MPIRRVTFAESVIIVGKIFDRKITKGTKSNFMNKLRL